MRTGFMTFSSQVRAGCPEWGTVRGIDGIERDGHAQHPLARYATACDTPLQNSPTANESTSPAGRAANNCDALPLELTVTVRSGGVRCDNTVVGGGEIRQGLCQHPPAGAGPHSVATPWRTARPRSLLAQRDA